MAVADAVALVTRALVLMVSSPPDSGRMRDALNQADIALHDLRRLIEGQG